MLGALAACTLVTDEPPLALEVTLTLRTPRVAVSDYPNGVPLAVQATNVGSGVLTIRPDSQPLGRSPMAGFALRAVDIRGRRVIDTELARRDTIAAFAAGETRRQRFLLTLGAERPGGLAPGSYTLVASYGGRESAPVRLTVVP